MKINYHNEDYMSYIFNITIFSILILFVILFGVYNNFFEEISGIIFISVIIIFLGIMLIFAIRKYKKRREQRNLNLFIIKNGECIKGRILSIYDNYTSMMEHGMSGIHNVTAEISYKIENEDKVVVVDKLCININSLKKYEEKIVSIYIYNNMSYIDIVN